MEKTIEQIEKELAAPFTREVNGKVYPDVKWLPKDGKSMRDRIICVPYISGQQVRDRLNLVLGLNGWMFESKLEADATRTGTLEILVGDKWIRRDGTGTQSQQEGEKGAETDALKRAARNFGIGAYLDEMPQHFIQAKAKGNGKLTPVDNNGKFLYGDNLHNFINGFSTPQGYLMQIAISDPEVFKTPEFQVIFNRYNIK